MKSKSYSTMNDNIYQKYILDSPESQDSLNDFSSIYYETKNSSINYSNQPNSSNIKKDFTKNSFQEINYQNYPNDSKIEKYYLSCDEKVINNLPKSIENNLDYWECSYNNSNKWSQINSNIVHRIPLPDELSQNPNFFDNETFIRKRNERERARVRSVNDGFERLKKHLSKHSEFKKDKRLSKVQTLKLAISYIRQLENDLKPKAI